MATELDTIQHAAPPALRIADRVAEIKTNVQMVQHLMRELMVEDVHYGKIPGTQKPSLYQPGAEVIALAFQWATRYVNEDLSFSDVVRYRVTCELFSRTTGEFIGSGQGEASSDEEKYRWRKAVCAEEFDKTPEDRRRTKWGKGRGGSTYTVQQVRTEPADIANTVLKMAAKRSFIAATRTASGCSDMFAQDLEDLPREVREAVTGQEGPPAPPPVLGAEGWAKLAAQAESFGYSPGDVVASAATLGYEGKPENMPRDVAKQLYRSMRDEPVAPQDPDVGPGEPATAPEDAETATDPGEAAGTQSGLEAAEEQPPGAGAAEFRRARREETAERLPSEMAAAAAAKAADRAANRKITAAQANKVYTQCTVAKVDDDELYEWLGDVLGVGAVEAIPAARLDEVLTWVKGHAAGKGGAA